MSMESAEIETGALQVQRTLIDFASQMETLNKMGAPPETDLSNATMKLTKSEKELRLISKNKEALDKRDEMLAMQNVDIESSFASSKLPEDKRTIEKQFRANLLESCEREHTKNINISEVLTSS